MDRESQNENQSKEKKLTPKEKFIAGLQETVETVVFVCVMVIIIRFFIGEIRWIPSASMRPTLIEGDRIFVERFSRFYAEPKRGDIMVFYPPEEEIKTDPLSIMARLTGFFCKDIAYIKRVVGMPGDKIEIKEAVEKIFGVKVEKVNTINVRGKLKRQGRTQGYTSKRKKAIVQRLISQEEPPSSVRA